MNHTIAGYTLYHALQAEGYPLPEEVADVSVELPADGVVQLVLRINLTDDTLGKVGKALIRMAQETREKYASVERSERPRSPSERD